MYVCSKLIILVFLFKTEILMLSSEFDYQKKEEINERCRQVLSKLE